MSYSTNDLHSSTKAVEDTLHGFKIFEQRLLNMIDYPYNDAPRQAYLQETLNEFLKERANFVLQLGPNHPVALQAQGGPLAPQVDITALHPNHA